MNNHLLVQHAPIIGRIQELRAVQLLILHATY